MSKQHKISGIKYALLTKIRSVEIWLSQHKDLISVTITFAGVIIAFASVLVAISALNNNVKTLEKSIEFSNESMNLSKQALCIQKEIEYRNIAPPSIIVSLKEPPTVLKQQTIHKEPFQTAAATFRFHIIPNSKTFFYPDSELDITNTIGLLANAALVNATFNSTTLTKGVSTYWIKLGTTLPSCGSPDSGNGFSYPLDYRNESVGEVECHVTTYPLTSGINFSSYPPNFLIVNFTFQIKDGYEHKYSSNISYNISIQDTNIEDIRQFKVFNFKKPENYTC
jgi:hypothetical protein